MADTCKLCKKNKTVCEEWSKSIQPMIEVLNNRIKPVCLKGKQFHVWNTFVTSGLVPLVATWIC